MNIDKLFDKKLSIITKEGKTYNIEKKQILIHGYSSFVGEAKVMLKNNNLYVLKDVYTFDNNRLRYSYDRYQNVKAFETYEKKDDGNEQQILVIERYDRLNTLIGSIGNIDKIYSDKINTKNDNFKSKSLILNFLKNKKSNKTSLDKLINTISN